MTWDPEACSSSYNVYRRTGMLFDSDHNGAADNYGSCFRNELSDTGMSDTTFPPPGQMYMYGVTGESFNGEGAIGYASNGLPRPNVTPCP